MLEATRHPLRHPIYRERYRPTKHHLGKQHGPNVTQIDIAPNLTETIWHMLTTNQPLNPATAAADATGPLTAQPSPLESPPQPASHIA